MFLVQFLPPRAKHPPGEPGQDWAPASSRRIVLWHARMRLLSHSSVAGRPARLQHFTSMVPGARQDAFAVSTRGEQLSRGTGDTEVFAWWCQTAPLNCYAGPYTQQLCMVMHFIHLTLVWSYCRCISPSNENTGCLLVSGAFRPPLATGTPWEHPGHWQPRVTLPTVTITQNVLILLPVALEF